eukprot:1847007-Pleurochrysis_carterae.AAC.5
MHEQHLLPPAHLREEVVARVVVARCDAAATRPQLARVERQCGRCFACTMEPTPTEGLDVGAHRCADGCLAQPWRVCKHGCCRRRAFKFHLIAAACLTARRLKVEPPIGPFRCCGRAHRGYKVAERHGAHCAHAEPRAVVPGKHVLLSRDAVHIEPVEVSAFSGQVVKVPARDEWGDERAAGDDTRLATPKQAPQPVV